MPVYCPVYRRRRAHSPVVHGYARLNRLFKTRHNAKNIPDRQNRTRALTIGVAGKPTTTQAIPFSVISRLLKIKTGQGNDKRSLPKGEQFRGHIDHHGHHWRGVIAKNNKPH